jgi:hypothetical protein
MTRLSLLNWAAQLLGVNHTGDRFYVSMTRRGLGLGIDAEEDGRMRVHLFTNVGPMVQWMQTLPVVTGPLPAVSPPTFRQGATGGDRYYYGFTWQHTRGSDYGNEQATVSAFVQWLRPIAQQQGIAFE